MTVTLYGQITSKQLQDTSHQVIIVTFNNVSMSIVVPNAIANVLNIGDIYLFQGTVQAQGTIIQPPIIA